MKPARLTDSHPPRTGEFHMANLAYLHSEVKTVFPRLSRVAGGLVVGALVSGAMAAGTLIGPAIGNATCASVGGVSIGSGCSTTPGSIALAIGPGATATATSGSGGFNSAFAIG